MRACACGPCGYDAHIHVCGWCARGRDCVYPSYLNCIAKMIDIRCTLRVEMFPILCDDFLLRFDRGFGSAVNGFASARRPPLRSRARTSPVHKSPHKYLAASARASPRSERGRGGGGVPFPVAPLPFPQGVIRRAWPPGALRVNLPSAFLADEAMWPPSCSAWRRTTTLSFSSFLLFSLGGVMEIATGGGGGAGLKRECVAARGGGACEERD